MRRVGRELLLLLYRIGINGLLDFVVTIDRQAKLKCEERLVKKRKREEGGRTVKDRGEERKGEGDIGDNI